MWSSLCVATKTFGYIVMQKGRYGKFSNPSTKHLYCTQHFLDISYLFRVEMYWVTFSAHSVFFSNCNQTRSNFVLLHICVLSTLLRQQWKDPYWTRWDKANQLNGDRLVVDYDITSLHYRAIDRKIPMDGESGRLVAGVSDTLSSVAAAYNDNDATQHKSQQHLFTLMGIATQLKPT